MRRRFGNPSVPGLVFYAVLVVGLIVGTIVGGGIGHTIAAIAGVLLALTILGTVGIGKAAGDAVDGRGRRRF